jgi:hypothetical protein
MSPYLNAPPLAPINAGAEKAQAQMNLGNAVINIGELEMKRLQRESDITEQVVTNKLYNDFDVRWSKRVSEITNSTNSVDVLKPDFLENNFENPLSEERKEIVANSNLSPKHRAALEMLLMNASNRHIDSGVRFKKQIRDSLATENITLSLEQSYARVDETVGDPQALTRIIANHKLMIEKNGGFPELAERHELKIKAYAAGAEGRADKKIYDSVYTIASRMGTRDDAEAFVRAQKLGSDEPKMLRDIETAFKTKEANAKLAMEANAKKVVLAGLEAVNSRKLTPEIVRKITETEGVEDPKYWYQALDAQNEAILRDKNFGFKTDGSVLAGLITYTSNPDTQRLSASQIANMEGISNELKISFIKTEDVRQDPVFVNTDASLRTMFGYELITGFGTKPLGGIYYNNAMTEILDFLARTPLRGAELKNKMYELSEPYLRDHWKSAHDSDDTITEKLSAMGIKASPARHIITPPSPTVNPPATTGEVEKRKPGESLKEYNKRIGL